MYRADFLDTEPGTGSNVHKDNGAAVGLDRLLCVDDDRNLLGALTRVLGSQYHVTTADSPRHALSILATEPAFAVVVADFDMPRMDGNEFLGHVRQRYPMSVRVMLTGNAKLKDTARSVNEGQIFRFLLKPITPDALRSVLRQGVEQYHLQIAEREILEQTLRGCVSALANVLAMAQPAAFGRAERLRRHVADLAEALQVANAWEIEIAAQLSQLGHTSLAPDVAERLYRGQPLTQNESDQVSRMPAIAEGIIARIPRLEVVRQIIRDHVLRFDGRDADPTHPVGSAIHIGARMLRVALDFDMLVGQASTGDEALAAMEARGGEYDLAVLTAFRKIRAEDIKSSEIREMPLATVREGMVFAADLLGPAGILLVARGQKVTAGLRERIIGQWLDEHGHTNVRMVVPTASP